ncbi:MAG: OmpA family protein [Deltaproteobacteria bacterium]|nr:OmpA family protein [Deltaproteobacteria bacterium]
MPLCQAPAPVQVKKPEPPPPPAPQKTRVEKRQEDIALVQEKSIHFPCDSAELLPDGRQTLDLLAGVMNRWPGLKVKILGHADQRGSMEYNLKLGLERAQSARQYLAEKGVDPSRVMADSMGEAQPLVVDENEEAYAKNRRCEIRVLAPPAQPGTASQN